jgi:CDP-diacylglycerol--glycerol-3-phosphate 3-phosphatidyltransferase/cardiolipin synthase
MSRLGFAALFPLTIGRPAWSLAVLAAAGASDVLDGWYARHFHQETAAGAALDALTDKIFVIAVVVTLIASGALSLPRALLLGTRDVGELALAARLGFSRRRQQLRAPHYSNVAGKIATALQYAAVIAVILGSSRQLLWLIAAAAGGAVACISYWARDTRGPRLACKST